MMAYKSSTAAAAAERISSNKIRGKINKMYSRKNCEEREREGIGIR